MTGNTIGEEFEVYVAEQISQRQTNQYSGYESLRTPDQIKYLNNTSAWVKLASGMEFTTEDNGVKGIERLKTLISEDNIGSYGGMELAKKTVLFNGLTEVEPATYVDGKKVEKISNNISRAGYSKDKSIWNDNSVYGLGGTQFGQQPMPGIKSISIKSLNRGSIREANIKIKAYNKNQFAIIELLYLRIGFTMMLEWGNDKFINNKGISQPMGNTIIEDLWFINRYVSQNQALGDIERYREEYSGNYDGFFGKVSNFTWTFASDGSYDIDLKLITMGDVVESLQLNIPVSPDQVSLVQLKLEDIEENPNEDNNTPYKDLEDSPILNAAQTTILGKYLFDSLAWDEYWKEDEKKEYFVVDAVKWNTEEKKRTKNPKHYSYYMTFGELIRLVKSYTINQVQNGAEIIFPQIDVDNDEADNKVNYYPNQISLDPRICLFQYKFGSVDLGSPLFNAKAITPPVELTPLKEYIAVKGDNVMYGKLMNMYLNYDFISKCLNDVNDDGEISIFKFFKKICNGINGALGNVNNIEPIIKDDIVLTFIDQNPIPGYLESFEKEGETVDLEVYGYNPTTKQSNFVKDISFKTQITPELSSIISIGTTAGGSVTKNDSTAFSFWNTGLKDRYQNKIIEPDAKLKREKEEEDLKTKAKKLAKYWEKNSYYVLLWHSYDENISDDKYGVFKETTFKNRYRYLLASTEKEYPGLSGKKLSVRQFVDAALEIEKKKVLLKATTPEALANQKNANYILLLVDAFGGSSGLQYIVFNEQTGQYAGKPIPNKSSVYGNYFNYDSEFISRSKSSYKSYLNSIKNATYIKATPEDRNPSGTIGFIPMGFNLTLQGISGIKMYNKLNINNTFLPSQYPKALKFVITKVDHKVENNVWETVLDTISIPKTQPFKKVDLSYVYQDEISAILPEDEQIPAVGFGELIYKNERREVITQEQVIARFNPSARPTYKKFFDDMESKYKGHTVLINSVGRSLAKSEALRKSNDPKNAPAGRSRHNYYASIDFNIALPNGTVLAKRFKNAKGKARATWINNGFYKLAQTHNLIWGGNFNKNEDCVHFAYSFNVDTAVANAIKKYGEVGSTGIPNLSGENGKSVELNKLT